MGVSLYTFELAFDIPGKPLPLVDGDRIALEGQSGGAMSCLITVLQRILDRLE